MIIIFNIIIVGIVGLIAYWWANEGLFSALLHLICVITAGSIALAFWEPITLAMLKGGGFDNYAWGVVLVGVFALLLVTLRYLSDKLVPANVEFPPWVNFTFGAATGASAGILSIGMCMIGSGFLQSTNEFMSYRGIGRDENNRAQIGLIGDPLWLDVPKLTSNFFSLLSVSTFHPDISDAPLRHYNPKIHELSTLVRDSFEGGKGMLSLAPDAAKATTLAMSDDGLIVVQVAFTSLAKDFGGQLILGSSQIRLIGTASDKETPKIVYPFAWKQEVKDVPNETRFVFDDVTHYATSVPGRQDTSIKFGFETDPSFEPRFIQIRLLRLDVPQSPPIHISSIAAKTWRGHQLTAEEILENWDPLGKDIQHLVETTYKIRGLRISTNGIPGTIDYDEDHYLVAGTLTTQWTHPNVSLALRIKGIRADPGTIIIQVDISPGGNASFVELLPALSSSASVNLVDTNGRKYSPIGYYISDNKRMQLTLIPSTPILSIGELPMGVLTSSRSKGMKLIFQVTEGQWIKELRVGDYIIGTCNVHAVSNRR